MIIRLSPLPFAFICFVQARINAVVLLWFSVACFWCQSFGDVPPYVCLSLLRGRTGTVVRASDFEPRSPLFEPRPVRRSLWP